MKDDKLSFVDKFEFAKELALNAGKIIKEMDPKKGIVGKTGKHNFLTDADLKSQKFIIDEIKKNFPGDKILAEESKIQIDLSATDTLWIIDPIDGTTNYSRGKNASMVLIAFAQKGIVVFGVAFNPFTNELYTARKGEGAFLNGQRIGITKSKSVSSAYVNTTVHYFSDIIERNFQRGLKIKPMPWLEVGGCSSLGVCETAAGKYGLYYHENTMPWDVAAPFLIAEEAGAVIKNEKGEKVDFKWNGFFALGEEKIVDEFLKIIK